jgi:hypothetical protein
MLRVAMPSSSPPTRESSSDPVKVAITVVPATAPNARSNLLLMPKTRGELRIAHS